MSNPSPANATVPAFTRDDYRRLAARIKKLRTARGWKQRELSQRAGIAPDRLSRLERGATVRADELAGLSRAFEVGLDELMFAAPGSGSPDALDRLTREIRGLLAPEELPVLIRLFQALAVGLRARRTAESKGDRE